MRSIFTITLLSVISAVAATTAHLSSSFRLWSTTSRSSTSLRSAEMPRTSYPAVWKSGTSLPSYTLTSVAFQVYSKVEITRHNWAHVTPGQEPIVVFGMTGFRPLPSNHLDYSTGWVVQGNKGISHSLASPVFNDDSDLLFELRRYGTTSARTPNLPSSALSGRSSPIPRRIGRPCTPIGFGPKSPGARVAGYARRSSLNTPASSYCLSAADTRSTVLYTR